MEPLSALLGAGGFVLGLAADRFATRWPEHDEEHPPGRAVDWRTAASALIGALALGLLPLRFSVTGDLLAVVVFGAWFISLVIGLATDLDQRMLPDLLTLPVIPIGLLYAASGSNPLVGTDLVSAVIAAVAIPAVIFLPSIPFGAGAFGIGDVKLLAGVGLMVGGSRALSSVVVALLVSGVVLAVLLAARRIGRRTYVPFGPFFILGALWAVLLRG
ncbi:MAG: prepilin peptidase [Candidatus Limnocylindrales bacterium]